jgi:hypothetical protein
MKPCRHGYSVEQGVHTFPVAQQPHAAIGEMNKVHEPNGPATFSTSANAPQGLRAVADAGR